MSIRKKKLTSQKEPTKPKRKQSRTKDPGGSVSAKVSPESLKPIDEKTLQHYELASLYSPERLKLITDDPTKLTPSERIRRERYLRGLSLEQMALILEISPSYLGSIERGIRPLSRRVIVQLHDRLNLSYDYLLEGSTITTNGIHKFIQEQPVYQPGRNMDSLLSVCSPDELDACYHLLHIYLTYRRGNNTDKDDHPFWRLPKE